MKLSVYIAATIDGFIARKDGRLDWLPGSNGEVDPSMGNEDFGYMNFFDSVDTMILGRNTFEFVSSMGEWPYGDKKVLVYSSTMKKLPAGLPETVQISSASPELLYEQLKSSGSEHVYVDGGKTIQSFIKAKLINELIITRVPVLIGEGIPLFGLLKSDIKLNHEETKSFKNGFVQSRYSVI